MGVCLELICQIATQIYIKMGAGTAHALKLEYQPDCMAVRVKPISSKADKILLRSSKFLKWQQVGRR